MKKYTWVDFILGTVMVFLIITSLEKSNIPAALGWASSLFWFHLYLNKSKNISSLKPRRK